MRCEGQTDVRRCGEQTNELHISRRERKGKKREGGEGEEREERRSRRGEMMTEIER